MAITWYLSKDGVWTGCGQCTPSRQQVARKEIAESLILLSFPTLSLSAQPAERQGQRCMQLLLEVFKGYKKKAFSQEVRLLACS